MADTSPVEPAIAPDSTPDPAPTVICDGVHCANLEDGPPGQRRRHRQWLGGYGHQPTTREKMRVPGALIRYLATLVVPKVDGQGGGVDQVGVAKGGAAMG